MIVLCTTIRFALHDQTLRVQFLTIFRGFGSCKNLGGLSVICTGSAVRNWYKVKTWLDQMFWQILQKLMLSGFLSRGILCLIHYLKLFWPHAASMASVRKVDLSKHLVKPGLYFVSIPNGWPCTVEYRCFKECVLFLCKLMTCHFLLGNSLLKSKLHLERLLQNF